MSLGSLFEEAEQEKERLREARNRMGMVWLAITAGVLFLIVYASDSDFVGLLLFGLVLFLISYVPVYRSYRDKYKQYFKNTLFVGMTSGISSELKYSKKGKISLKYYLSSHLFPKNFSDYEGEDLIYGEYEDFYLQISELDVGVTGRFRPGSLNQKRNTLFSGLFVTGEFMNDFPAEMRITPHESAFASLMEKFFPEEKEEGFESVQSGNAAFDNAFEIISDGREYTGSMLTSDLRGLLFKLKEDYGNVWASFRSNYFFMGVSSRDDLFEPHLQGSADDAEQLREIYDQFRRPLEVVEKVAEINREFSGETGTRA